MRHSVAQDADSFLHAQPRLLPSDSVASIRNVGGETGIRTLGTREGTTVFETAPFDHSGTSPQSVCAGV